MSKNKKRTYISVARNASAKATKDRILASAKKLFQKKGFEAMTFELLAKTANVSPSTIYALFGSKQGILRTLIDEALPADQYLELISQINQETSAKNRLKITAKFARKLYDAERKIQFDIFRGASLLAPAFKEVEKEREDRRHQRQEEIMKKMAEEGALAERLNLSQARDILWAFTGRDLYRMLVIEQEWSSQEYETWLAELLIKSLLKSSL